MDEHVRRWWIGFTVALFLLVPVDLLTTLVSVAEHGVAVEANPIMQWLLSQGAVALIAVHVGVIVVTVYAFHVAIGAVQRAPVSYRPSLGQGVDIWLTLVLVTGVVLVANNLLVLL